MRAWANPSLFLGVAVAAFVLGVAGGSRPMFASSAAAGSLGRDLQEGCSFSVGLRVERPALLGTDEGEVSGPFPRVDEATRALDRAVGRPTGIDPVLVTIDGGDGELVAGGGNVPVQLVERTGFREHITELQHGSQPGVWVPDSVVNDRGIRVDDQVSVIVDGLVTTLPVAGVYRDLRSGRDRFWCSMRFFFEPRTASGGAPNPVLLFDPGEIGGVVGAGGFPVRTTWWEYAPSARHWDLPTAKSSIGALELVSESTNNRSESLGDLLGTGRSSVDVAGSVHKSERTAASVESVAGPVALGTVGVAVVMLLAAARSWLSRRSQEVTVLWLRGAGSVSLATKGILELLPAMVLGGVTGLAAAVVLVRTIGPDPRIEPGAFVEGSGFVVAALVVAFAAVAAVVVTGARRVGISHEGASPRSALPLWEPVVLGLAAAAFYELHTRETIVEDTRVDGLLLLFPLLLLAGGAGLLARLVLSPRPLGWIAARLPTAAWLAMRRLAAARVRAALIVTGAAISIGIVVFAGALSASVQATLYAKATLGAGAAQTIRLSRNQPPLEAAPLPGISTLVTRTSETGVIRHGHDEADVLGVDPETFADAAYWDGSFASASLSDLLGRLGPAADDRAAAPAIAVGDGIPDQLVLTLDGIDQEVELEVKVVGRAQAFPGLGYQNDRPLVVVSRDVLAEHGVDGLSEIWVDDPSPRIPDRLARDGMQIVFSSRPAADNEGTLLQPQLWAIDYLQVVGLAAGLVAVAGLGLYFAANSERRQLGAVFARRLGLRARQGATATGLEVTTIVLAGFLFGVGLAWLAVRLVYRNLDPLPRTPPDPIMRLDLPIVGMCALGALVAAVLVGAAVERRAARADLPKLLRDAG